MEAHPKHAKSRASLLPCSTVSDPKKVEPLESDHCVWDGKGNFICLFLAKEEMTSVPAPSVPHPPPPSPCFQVPVRSLCPILETAHALRPPGRGPATLCNLRHAPLPPGAPVSMSVKQENHQGQHHLPLLFLEEPTDVLQPKGLCNCVCPPRRVLGGQPRSRTLWRSRTLLTDLFLAVSP